MSNKDKPMKRNLSISWKEGQILKKALGDLGKAQNVPDCQEISEKIDILLREMNEECRDIANGIRRVMLAKALCETGFCNTFAQARRMISKKLVSVNGELKTNASEKIEIKDDTIIEIERAMCRKLVDGIWI